MAGREEGGGRREYLRRARREPVWRYGGGDRRAHGEVAGRTGRLPRGVARAAGGGGAQGRSPATMVGWRAGWAARCAAAAVVAERGRGERRRGARGNQELGNLGRKGQSAGLAHM